jgi:Zn-finger nucleic acid-binding protein
MDEKVIKCPKCVVDMEKLSNGKYVIDRCPKCEGVFLDKGEMHNISRQGFISYVRNYFRR